MVFILSEENDFSTSTVIEWLHFYNISFVRINTEDVIDSLAIYIYNDAEYFVLQSGNKIVDSRDISFFYYRRGFITINYFKNLFADKKVDKIVAMYLKNDLDDVKEIICSVLENNVPQYGNMQYSRLNKLTVLKYAKQCGLNIPNTTVVNTQKLASDLDTSNIISKGISDNIGAEFSDSGISFGTPTIDTFTNDFPERFFPTLFQTKIDKEFEIRSFFHNGKFYSMAIMSQGNTKTTLDYRNYDSDIPNRNLPFTLPTEISKKTQKLFELLNLNTGSVDFMVEKNTSKFIFLEINTGGQYGGLSLKCNYNIEHQIAKEIRDEINK